MLFPLLQIAIVSALLVYFGQWRRNMRRRNVQSWDGLLGQLRSDWSARDLSDQFLWKEGLNATTDDIWQRLDGPKGLWAMFQNARVMLEMADYAKRNSSELNPIDPMILEALRSDAMQIRLCVLMALGQYALSKATAGVKVNAFRAASLYSGMAARMTILLQDHAALVLPDFVAAM
ncbi:hypothetical protein [Acidicapsa ligni]|uniref:hypothetical protein n=1 Tax=Acidicapsa ligni TaxID=542300 RepID=UPI0021DF55FF|nr:hypothetical protein [Acidicapsa ligni]